MFENIRTHVYIRGVDSKIFQCCCGKPLRSSHLLYFGVCVLPIFLILFITSGFY